MATWRRDTGFPPRRRPGMAALSLAALSLAAAVLAAGAAMGHAQQSGAGAPPAESVHLVGASSNNFPPLNVLDADRALTGFGREPLLAGYTQREVYLFVGSAIGLSLLAAGTVFGLFFAGRMRSARDRLAQAAVERAEACEALRESGDQSRATFEQAAVGICHVAPDGHFLRVNQKFCDIIGYSRDELLDKTFHDITHPDDLDADLGNANQVLADKISTYTMEKRYFRKDGSTIWINLTVSLVRHPSGAPNYFISVIEDITGRKRVEESERQLRSQLAHAGRLSTVGNMAAGLAHEINQPLAAIGGYVQASARLLRSGKGTTEEVVADLERANQQVMRAADVANRLRGTVAKEAAKKTELDLNACIGEVTDLLESEFRARKFKLVVDLAGALPAIKADKVQIQQVILNLMQNSMEAAGRSGGAECLLTVRTLASTDGTVKVAVKDNGPGLPPGIQGEVFSPFVTTKRDGLGLGLSVSKSIIESHGGRIWAVSDAGHGATFTFTLPAATLPAATPPAATLPAVTLPTVPLAAAGEASP